MTLIGGINYTSKKVGKSSRYSYPKMYRNLYICYVYETLYFPKSGLGLSPMNSSRVAPAAMSFQLTCGRL